MEMHTYTTQNVTVQLTVDRSDVEEEELTKSYLNIFVMSDIVAACFQCSPGNIREFPFLS